MEILLSNPLIILALILIVMSICAYFIVKPRKKKKNTSDEKEKSNIDKNSETQKSEDVNLIQTEESEKKEDGESSENSSKEKKKLKKLKPEITRVYEKKQLQTKSESKVQDSKEKEEQELLKKMQFVKTSKTVSKLKPYDGQVEIAEEMQIEQNADLQETQNSKEKQSRINKPKKLSESIKNDNCDEFQEKLFRRAADTLANSNVKVSISDDGRVQELPDKDSMKAWLEEKKRENLAEFMVQDAEEKIGSDYDYEDITQDEFDLNARTMLVVDSILNRKGKKSRKK